MTSRRAHEEAFPQPSLFAIVAAFGANNCSANDNSRPIPRVHLETIVIIPFRQIGVLPGQIKVCSSILGSLLFYQLICCRPRNADVNDLSW